MQAIAILRLLTNNIEHRIDQFRALGIMPLRPIISRARLPEHEVVRPEDLAERAGSDRVHRPRLQVHEDCAWDVPPTAGLIIVNIDPLELKLRVATVLARVINAVLIADHLPKFGADLIAALATLNVQDFPHFLVRFPRAWIWIDLRWDCKEWEFLFQCFPGWGLVEREWRLVFIYGVCQASDFA